MSDETLFHEALARPSAERAAFLDAACAGRPDLRAAVAELLDAHEGADSLLDRPPTDLRPPEGTTGEYLPDAPTPRATPAMPAAPGVVIAGRYTLIEKIGEGGMGEVWVAHQAEPVKRKVALKLIRAGMDARGVLARFEQERRALALMDHPNIARVLDGGATPDGHPFFAMELVNGLSLLKFCDEARLTPRQRLELFVPICQAVQHAHQKGIVHRDLKPANLLVTRVDGRPVPKVIDFGVAKAVAGELTAESPDTQFGAVVGTLEYMAPEQAGLVGEDVDTRADIYSLGVILYELLTGLRPFDGARLMRAALAEVVRVLREEEPSRPSTRLSTAESLPSVAAQRSTEPRRLMAILRGELDWVVMKCLEKPRDRRYESASALARDVERYLADEPVEARPPSTAYRVAKFLRRHRVPAAAAALVLLALVAGAAGTTWGMLRAEERRQEANEAWAKEALRATAEAAAKEREAQQRARAERARDRTREALDNMTSTVTGDSLAAQAALTEEQKQFLTGVLVYYREFAGDQAEDEVSRSRTAAAANRVGLIESHLGRKAEAETALRQSLETYAALAKEFPTHPEHRRDLAGAHNNLANLLRGLGKQAQAEEEAQRALALREQLVADAPEDPNYRRCLADSLNNLGVMAYERARLTEAERHHRRALEIRKQLAADGPEPDRNQAVSVSYLNLAAVLGLSGDERRAEEYFRAGLAVQEPLVAASPRTAEYRRQLGALCDNLGQIVGRRGRAAEAEELHRKAIAIFRKLVDEFPAVPDYQLQLARSQNAFGALLAGRGRAAEAEEAFQVMVTLRERLASDYPTVKDYRADLASGHNNLGQLLHSRGKHPQAEEALRRSLELRERLAREDPVDPVRRRARADSCNNLGRMLRDRGRLAEAEEMARKSLEIHEGVVRDAPEVPDFRCDLGTNFNELGQTLMRASKLPEAEAAYRRGIAILEKLVVEIPAPPRYSVDLGAICCNLGSVIATRGRPAEALPWFEKAIRVLGEVAERPPHALTGQARLFLRNSHHARAVAGFALKRHAEVVADCDRAIQLSPPHERMVLRSLRVFALRGAGREEEAVADLEELSRAPGCPASVLYDFACLYAAAGEKHSEKKAVYLDRAMEMLRRAVAAGFRDLAHLKRDTNLEPLRGREDFQKLLQELEGGQR